jgi:heavy metal sensor kinase
MPEMSLRNRIAFYYTIATAFLVAAVLAIIFFTVDRIVYRHFDDELRFEVREQLQEAHMGRYFDGFERFMENDINDDEDKREHDGREQIKDADVDLEFIQLVDRAGKVIKKSANLSGTVLSYNPELSDLQYFNSTAGGMTVRQVQLPLVTRNGSIAGYLIVAVPLKNAILVLRDLQNIILISFPCIILMLFVLTRLIAGKSIRPIDEVIATAEKMTQSSLGQRIPLPPHRDELYRLSVTINALLDRLQDAFQREKQFTADASHELKTPLAAVKGTLDVLVRKPREVAHYEARIQYCQTELKRMARLIDQLLMLARYESDMTRPHIVEVALFAPLESVIARLQPFALEKMITLSFIDTESGRVAADPAMLEMILENILSNAIKYSPQGSSVEISTSRRSGAVVCTITDHGVGIPEEKRQAIFERFYRVDESRSASTGGFGLGLSIVKKLADLQRIGIVVSSGADGGTTFELLFPKA